jgi:hypothetical protein
MPLSAELAAHLAALLAICSMFDWFGGVMITNQNRRRLVNGYLRLASTCTCSRALAGEGRGACGCRLQLRSRRWELVRQPLSRRMSPGPSPRGETGVALECDLVTAMMLNSAVSWRCRLCHGRQPPTANAWLPRRPGSRRCWPPGHWPRWPERRPPAARDLSGRSWTLP